MVQGTRPLLIARDESASPDASDSIDLGVDVDLGDPRACALGPVQITGAQSLPRDHVPVLLDRRSERRRVVPRSLPPGLKQPRPGDAGTTLVIAHHVEGQGDRAPRGLLGAHAAAAPDVRYISAMPMSPADGTSRPARSAAVQASLSTRS